MRAERSKLRVLLLDGHTRQVLPMAEALRQSGHWVEVVCHSRFDMGYVSRWPQRRWLAPDPKLEPEAFAGEVESILRQGGIDVVIPLFDYGAETAARCKPEWSRYSRVAVNDWPVFQLARNKLQTMRFCMHHDIPCPRTVLDEEPTTLDHLTFPVVVKPQRGVSAAGFHRVDRVEDLPAIIDSTRIAHGPVLVQEYIPQTDLQYKAEVFMDTEGTVKAAVVFSKVRWHPVAGGSSTLNITVSRPDIIETCVRMLRAMGWIGYADVDLIQDPRDNVAKVMEVNPRITGSVKIAFAAGVDFAEMVVRQAMGWQIDSCLDYQAGQYLRYFYKDILWFLSSPDRWQAQPSWFRFFAGDTVDQIFSLRDPMPSVTHGGRSLLQMLRYLLKPSSHGTAAK